MSQDLLETRYLQLLGYIAELDRLRTATVRTIDGHLDAIDLSELPKHSSVSWNPDDPTAFLVVTRCETPQPLAIPESLEGWVNYTPNQTKVEPSCRTSTVKAGQELRWEDFGPEEDWDVWLQSWRGWAEKASPAYAARDLYVRLYNLHATLERSSEQVELVAADVAVALKAVDHPILINSVFMEFDVELSRITVGCLEEPTQVYSDAIREVLPEAGSSIASARKEVTENPDIWAFGGEEVNRFATRFVQGADPDGELIQGERLFARLSARRHPWLLLRKRATGLAEVAEGLIAKFHEDGLIPGPIQPILLDRDEEDQAEPEFRGEPDEDENSYFTKPANVEQLAILRNYRRRRCVHVQGPPGTGKTHTIANLIGHFLAEGKSVLVTSEKAQALSVLRAKVVEELRPLCVSMVGADAGEGLKAGMRGLFEKLSGTEASRLASDIERLQSARARTIQALRQARHAMREIIEKEHLPIETLRWRGSPADAGRYVNARRATQGWIPGDVRAGSEPPLSQSEFIELLDLLGQYQGDVVPEVRKPLPPTSEVPSPDDLKELLGEIEAVSKTTPPLPAANVPDLQDLPGGPSDARILLELVDRALSRIQALDSSYRELANRSVETPSICLMWETWGITANKLLEKEQEVTADAAPYGFVIRGDEHSVLSCAKSLLEHVSRIGRAVNKPRLLNRQDKLLFDAVSSKRPLGDEQSLKALIQHLEFEDQRDRFRVQVQAAAQSIGLNGFGNGEPERFLGRDSLLKTALQWTTQEFEPIVGRMTEVGLGFDRATTLVPVNLSAGGPVDRRAWWLENAIRPVLLRYLHSVRLRDLLERKDLLADKARSWSAGDPSQPLRSLSDAILTEDLHAYEQAYLMLEELRAAAEPVQRRDELLERIRALAELFAASLEDGSLSATEINGTLEDAWTYSLIDQELRRRNASSLVEAKSELERIKRELDQTTIKLADALAWAAQHKRVTQPVRSALSRFHEAQRRIGRGTGRRAPEFLDAMRNSMRDAKDAFPVWIMPLYEVSKSFDFTKTRFDVVIVDESSQLSAVGLITLLLADSAIVVGDDEQTEPSLVGVSVDSVRSLIQEHLVDFTDRILWSPDSSLYSFAGRFGSTVALREHFRCVPQIISFSSRLCYQGKIQPLRESRGVVQLPHVVPIRCQSLPQPFKRDVNEDEASEIASLLIACYEQPEYQDESFGVISLRGSADARGADPQTSRVMELLQSALGAAEYEKLVAKTSLKFGVPPAFQGDERDIVFISVGDAPSLQTDSHAGPLRMLSGDTLPGGQYKKRLNVAVSRARNQVWVVHSFPHFEADLKEGDVRRQLLEFAYAPDQWLESTQAVNPRAESPFEEAVYADLVRLGFRVTAQVPVGHYRIDLVAEDEDGRVAIECDGDAYHQDAAADLSRHIVLERCGWKFIRVRGSEYYRDPAGAINRIVKELERLGVTPTHAQPEQIEPHGALLQRVRDRVQQIRADVAAGRSVIVMRQSASQSNLVAPEEPSTEPGSLGAREDDTDAGLLDRIQGFSGAEQPPAETTYTQVDGTSTLIRGCSIQVDDYVQFSEKGYADPKSVDLYQISKSLIQIVRVEGPATEATIFERYRVATGYGRFKGPTRALIVNALRMAVVTGSLVAEADYPGSNVKVYRVDGSPTVRFRKRGPRDLQDVPMGEIVRLASVLAREGDALGEETLFRLMLQFYGLKRLTAQAEVRLRKARELATEKVRTAPRDTNDDIGGVDPIGAPKSTSVIEVPEPQLAKSRNLESDNRDLLSPTEVESVKPVLKPLSPLLDKEGRIIRVRVLGSSGQEVISAGTVVGSKKRGNAVEWDVLVDETHAVHKFLSPPATLKKLKDY